MTFTRETIQAEYERLGYSKGWTFMGVPEANIGRARVVIVGLNPGGGGAGDGYAYQGIWDLPAGTGYFDERWGPDDSFSPIQLQVKAWHSSLKIEPEDSLCAQFVPFRSPNWSSLQRKDEAIDFSNRLWTWLLSETPASLFITMGKLPAHYLSLLIDARPVARNLPTGWGKQTIDVYDSPSGRRIIAMPHPSRFTLFCRGAASEIAEASFRCAAGSKAGA